MVARFQLRPADSISVPASLPSPASPSSPLASRRFPRSARQGKLPDTGRFRRSRQTCFQCPVGLHGILFPPDFAESPAAMSRFVRRSELAVGKAPQRAGAPGKRAVQTPRQGSTVRASEVPAMGQQPFDPYVTLRRSISYDCRGLQKRSTEPPERADACRLSY
jgi:hypothetical protein